jgi:hypothetical protein
VKNNYIYNLLVCRHILEHALGFVLKNRRVLSRVSEVGTFISKIAVDRKIDAGLFSEVESRSAIAGTVEHNSGALRDLAGSIEGRFWSTPSWRCTYCPTLFGAPQPALLVSMLRGHGLIKFARKFPRLFSRF